MDNIVVRLVYALILSISLLSSSKVKSATLPTITELMNRDGNVMCAYREYFTKSDLLKPCANVSYPDNADFNTANINIFLCFGAYDALYKVCDYSNRQLLPRNDIVNAANFTASVQKFIPVIKKDKDAVEESFCKSLEGLKSAYKRINQTVSQLVENLTSLSTCRILCFDFNFRFKPLCALMAWIRNIDQEVIDRNKKTVHVTDKADITERHESGKVSTGTSVQSAIEIQPPNPAMETNDDSVQEPKQNSKLKQTAESKSKTNIDNSKTLNNNEKIDERKDVAEKPKIEKPAIHQGNENNAVILEPHDDVPKDTSKVISKKTDQVTQFMNHTMKSNTIDISASLSPQSPQISASQPKVLNPKEQTDEVQNTKTNNQADERTLNDPKLPLDDQNSIDDIKVPENIENSDMGLDDPNRNDEDLQSSDENMEPASETGNQKPDLFGPSEPRNILSHYPNMRNEDDSHFFTYFTIITLVCIAGYVGYHNKQKVLAIVLEGRRSRNGRGRRRPSTANYRKLDCTLEEAVTSQCNANVTHVIY